MIYLDNISATPLHADVKEAMIGYIQDGIGNPISQHRMGDAALEALEKARKSVADLVNTAPETITFTSGGTESINHAIKGVAFATMDKGKHIVTSNIEHQAVLRSMRMLMRAGWHVTSGRLRKRRESSFIPMPLPLRALYQWTWRLWAWTF